MKRLNYIEIETKSGYRSFELHQGDITDLPFDVDMMCVSSFSGSYTPTPGTVIGALNKKWVSVGQLAENCLYNYKGSFGAWISKKNRGKRGALVDGIKKEIAGDIIEITDHIGDKKIFSELNRVVSSVCRSFELGGISRKLAEFIVQYLNPRNKKFELYKGIDSLKNIGVARWITGYMHILRAFGNKTVHHKNTDNQNPKFVDEKDLEVCLFCIQRVLNFYRDFKFKNG